MKSSTFRVHRGLQAKLMGLLKLRQSCQIKLASTPSLNFKHDTSAADFKNNSDQSNRQLWNWLKANAGH